MASAEQTSSRRQPVRQARINPSKAPNGARAPASPDDRLKSTHGFFPGITHFTDSITALPKEMIRHYAMMKEVDAKIYLPEEKLRKLLATIPPQPPTRDDAADMSRRKHFYEAGVAMSEMLGSLDEKNHVMSTANEALEKLVARCKSSWPRIEQEISEEVRWGNLNHWAYTDRSTEKKATATNERTRRDAANASHSAAGAAEAETTTLRSDTRARTGRKLQAYAVNNSDGEDDRHVRKTGGGSKRAKPADLSSLPNGTGLGIPNGTSASNKRRKIEKPATNGGAAMEKSLSAVFGNNGRNAGGSPRDTPATENSRKKPRAAPATGTATGRRRYVLS